MNKTGKIILQILALLLEIGFAFYLAHIATGNDTIKELVSRYGYIAIFFIAVFSGFNVFVPIPAASLMPLYIESGLSFFPTVMFITLGMTAADIICFYLAKAGKGIIIESWGDQILEKFWSLPEKYYRYPLAVLFIFASLAPLPNEVLLIPLTLFFGYGFKELIPIVLAGNLIFTILLSTGLLNIFNSL